MTKSCTVILLAPDRAGGLLSGRSSPVITRGKGADHRNAGITSSAKRWKSSRKKGAIAMKMKWVTPALR
jgi:hypothetical protein